MAAALRCVDEHSTMAEESNTGDAKNAAIAYWQQFQNDRKCGSGAHKTCIMPDPRASDPGRDRLRRRARRPWTTRWDQRPSFRA